MFSSALVDAPVVIRRPHICAQPLDALRGICPDFSISEECESILVSVFDIVVFEAWFLNRLEEVDSLSHEHVSKVALSPYLEGSCGDLRIRAKGRFGSFAFRP